MALLGLFSLPVTWPRQRWHFRFPVCCRWWCPCPWRMRPPFGGRTARGRWPPAPATTLPKSRPPWRISWPPGWSWPLESSSTSSRLSRLPSRRRSSSGWCCWHFRFRARPTFYFCCSGTERTSCSLCVGLGHLKTNKRNWYQIMTFANFKFVPICEIVADTIDWAESRLLEGTKTRSERKCFAAKMAASEPAIVGMMLSNFCLREAMAVKSPRTLGCKITSGWVNTALSRGCGYEANWLKMEVTSKFVARLLLGISSTFSNRRSRKGPIKNHG